MAQQRRCAATSDYLSARNDIMWNPSGAFHTDVRTAEHSLAMMSYALPQFPPTRQTTACAAGLHPGHVEAAHCGITLRIRSIVVWMMHVGRHTDQTCQPGTQVSVSANTQNPNHNAACA